MIEVVLEVMRYFGLNPSGVKLKLKELCSIYIGKTNCISQIEGSSVSLTF